MLSPDQVDRLQDEVDKFGSAIIVGCLFFFVGGAMAVFASQEFAMGTDFMQRLAGAEQAAGVVLILFGWIKVRSVNAELERHASHAEDEALGAGAGH